jgi:glycosyltransferase involved in cell wall biosynthesis
MSDGRPRSRLGDDISGTAHFDLCYLGLISLDRGLDTMLAVLESLKNCRLHLFGRIANDCLDLLTTQRDRVIIHGHVDQADAFPVMAQCGVGLALLKPVGDYPESYPTKLFEYMALGLPVITSDFPLYRSIIETHQCGFCVDPTDVTTVVERIKWLIEHPSEAQRMGEKGKREVGNLYCWLTEAKKLLELYQNIDFK